MTTGSTGLSKDERRGALANLNCCRTIEETASILGIGVPSLRAMLARGEGPRVTRLSRRRMGIMDSHREEWLAARAAAV